jgi:hypothetical protein
MDAESKGARASWPHAELAVSFTVLAMAAVSVWWHSTLNLEARTAWSGFSPVYFLAALKYSDWFSSNFPTGTEEFLKSLPMLVYLLADQLHIPVFLTMSLMTALEIALLIAAGAFATRMLRPEAGWPAAWLVGLFLIAGGLFAGDIGRWGHPVYGFSYNFAYAAIIVGVAAAISGRLLIAALALAFAVASHAILGLLGSAFAGTAVLVVWRKCAPRTLIAAVLAYFTLAGGWLTFVTLTSELGASGIPSELYVAFARLMSFHWYPVDMGLFWERHWERLFPFLSVLVLLAIYLPDRDGRLLGNNLQAAAGFAAMLGATILGVLLARHAPEPFLVKLALQRASGIFLIVAAPYVVAGMWQDVREGTALRAGAGVSLLVFPFFNLAGVPIVLALVLAAVVAFDDIRRCGVTARAFILGVGIAIVLCYATWFWIGGVLADWTNAAYTGFSALTASQRWMLAGLIVAVLLFRRAAQVGTLVLLLAIGFSSVSTSSRFHELRNPDELKRATDYLDAQRWANARTPTGTLFMPDPAHAYGWREFSLRPSFGNLREWLYAGWVYNPKLGTFKEGLKRVRALGLEPTDYLHFAAERPWQAGVRLEQDVQRKYYRLTADEFMRIARDFGVRYFVFDKRYVASPLPLPVAYENSSFIIATPPPNAPAQ